MLMAFCAARTTRAKRSRFGVRIGSWGCFGGALFAQFSISVEVAMVSVSLGVNERVLVLYSLYRKRRMAAARDNGMSLPWR